MAKGKGKSKSANDVSVKRNDQDHLENQKMLSSQENLYPELSDTEEYEDRLKNQNTSSSFPRLYPDIENLTNTEEYANGSKKEDEDNNTLHKDLTRSHSEKEDIQHNKKSVKYKEKVNVLRKTSAESDEDDNADGSVRRRKQKRNDDLDEIIEDVKPNNQTKKGSKFISSLLLVGFIILIVVIVICYYSVIPGISQKHSYQSIDSFKKAMNIVESSFPMQYEETIRLIRNVGLEHLRKVFLEDKESLTPLAFLIAGYKEANQTQMCFVHKIAEAFTHASFDIIDSKLYTGNNGRKKFDDQIQKSLKDSQKVVVIKDINLLPFDVAQMFMSYADAYNDLATYPQSLLLLTASLPFPYEDKNNRKGDEGRVGDFFKETLWKNQDNTNNIAALWSRVGDGLVLIKPEKKNPCN